jgi:uncharacterized membrane protein YeaQ/YmgE (transglycosylase-associated protein family)
MGILSWIIFGLVAGALAKLITPGNDPGGCLVTILLGIAGAALGGWIGTQLGFGSITGFDLRSLGMAIFGSFLLLVIYRILRRA